MLRTEPYIPSMDIATHEKLNFIISQLSIPLKPYISKDFTVLYISYCPGNNYIIVQ